MNGKKRKLLLRLFCFVFSIFIWLYVISSAEVEIEKNIPLNLEIPENYALVDKKFSTLNYKLKGPRVFVRNILEQKKEISINLKDYYKKGQKSYSVSLKKYQLSLPIGVKLLGFEPTKINFKLEKSLTKKIPVTLNYEQENLNEFDLKKVKISPEFIDVSGARSVIKKLKKITTTLVEMKSLAEKEKVELELNLPNPNIKTNVQKVTVNYTLDSKLAEFTFTKIPIIFHTRDMIQQALPNVANVALKGNKDLINNLDTAKIEVIAKVPAGNSKQKEVPLIVNLPQGIELLNLEPKSITVLVE